MFKKEIYADRRKKLSAAVGNGIILLVGNVRQPFNYANNSYPFRQDSTFLYFVGIDEANLAVAIDCESGNEYLFGEEVNSESIIWNGKRASLQELADSTSIAQVKNISELQTFIGDKKSSVHYIAPYQVEVALTLSNILGININQLSQNQSKTLIDAIVEMRSVKESFEIEEIEKAVNITAGMQRQAMRYIGDLIATGKAATERDVLGKISKIAIAQGYYYSFEPIITTHGEILHTNRYNNPLKKGGMLLIDAGAETESHYAGDLTRTIPVGGNFSARQRDIYDIVLAANETVKQSSMPGISWKNIHDRAARTITSGLKNLGLMKGDTDNIVSSGAYALFFPHGIGHLLGLDAHDMENYGEDNVGYNAKIKRSEVFGPSNLRFALELKKNMVITNEPGIYFIPQLIDEWRKEKKFAGFINYDRVERYKSFGGIRIEDDLLITDNSCRELGSPVPKTVEDVEELIKVGIDNAKK